MGESLAMQGRDLGKGFQQIIAAMSDHKHRARKIDDAG
jgi:hypothetical protein